MKILVFADFHGDVAALQQAADISERVQPQKTVICGDILGWGDAVAVSAKLSLMQGVLYLVKGNNDWHMADELLPTPLEDSVLMRHFGRTLFFTHGDVYNPMRIPPILGFGDVLVYGHNHKGELFRQNGLYMCNVGSLARPRYGVPNYLTLDEQGATLLSPDGETLCSLRWSD